MGIKYEVRRDDKVGRYAVASTDIEAGDEIAVEYPFAVGPKSTTVPLCLGCHKPVDCTILCSKCRWPVCCEQCSSSPYHQAECEVFSKSKAKFQLISCRGQPSPQYECITPLRLLLAKEKYPERWAQEVEVMQSHCDERKMSADLWAAEYNNVVRYLRLACKLSDRFSDADIHRACGIIAVNCFEVITPYNYNIQGLYPKMSLPSHSCVINTTRSIFPLDNYKMLWRTTVDIKQGEELFTTYTSFFQPTIIRRDAIKKSKYFDCTCPRCQDSTELGSHMGSIQCKRCYAGLLTSTNPLEPKAGWRCDICQFDYDSKFITELYFRIKEEIDEIDSMPNTNTKVEAAEEALQRYEDLLHPNHIYLISLAYTLIQLYGRVGRYKQENLPYELVERKIELCKRVLKALDLVEPGFTRSRGVTLFDYATSLILLSDLRYYMGLNSEQEMTQALSESLTCLRESFNIFILEPPTSNEFQLAALAQNAIDEINKKITSEHFGVFDHETEGLL